MTKELLDTTLSICTQIPAYEYYLGPSEVQANAQALSDTFPDTVQYRKIGESAQGRDVGMLRIGDLESTGARSLLIKGIVHPNEGISTLTTDFLSKQFAEHPDLLQALGYDRALIIPEADPDGYALQGWAGKSFTVESYIKGFYRSPRELQVCFGYPHSYKRLQKTQGLPESMAVAQVIEEYKPDFMAALHNSALGRTYMYVPEQQPPFAEAINAWLDYCDLQPSTGPIETPFATKWAPGLYAGWTLEQKYDALKPADNEPLGPILYGAGSDDFLAKANPGALHIDTEIPYFQCAALEDNSPSDRRFSDVVQQGIQKRVAKQKLIGETLALLDTNDTLRTHPFFVATASQHRLVDSFLKVQQEVKEGEAKATASEVFQQLHMANFYSLTQIGQIARLAVLAGEAAIGNELHSLIDADLAEIEAAGGKIEPIPPRKLAAAQIGLVLISAALAGRPIHTSSTRHY